MSRRAVSIIASIALMMLAFIVMFPRVAAGVYVVSILLAFLGLLIEGVRDEQ